MAAVALGDQRRSRLSTRSGLIYIPEAWFRDLRMDRTLHSPGFLALLLAVSGLLIWEVYWLFRLYDENRVRRAGWQGSLEISPELFGLPSGPDRAGEDDRSRGRRNWIGRSESLLKVRTLQAGT